MKLTFFNINSVDVFGAFCLFYCASPIHPSDSRVRHHAVHVFYCLFYMT